MKWLKCESGCYLNKKYIRKMAVDNLKEKEFVIYATSSCLMEFDERYHVSIVERGFATEKEAQERLDKIMREI